MAALAVLEGRRLGLAGLSETCRSCPVVHECGGGLFAHRYSTGSGFDNPSVVHAGASARLRLPVRDGYVHLPTLGTVLLPGAAADNAEFRTADGRFTLSTPDVTVVVDAVDAESVAGWQPVRQLAAPGLNVLLEDGDPHRDCHDGKAGERLDAATAGAWSLHGAAPG